MNETATLSSKFQISIPTAIRTAQHWEAGLTFAFIPKGTGVLLIPVPRKHDLKGLAKGARHDEPCATTTVTSLAAGSDRLLGWCGDRSRVRAGRRVMDFDGCAIAVIDPRNAE